MYQMYIYNLNKNSRGVKLRSFHNAILLVASWWQWQIFARLKIKGRFSLFYLVSLKQIAFCILITACARCPKSLLSFLSVIGYGLTNTGYTVLAGMLVAVLGLTFVSQSGNAPFRRSQTLQERRQQFIEHCQIHPELPECVQKIQKRRQRKYRQRRH